MVQALEIAEIECSTNNTKDGAKKTNKILEDYSTNLNIHFNVFKTSK